MGAVPCPPGPSASSIASVPSPVTDHTLCLKVCLRDTTLFPYGHPPPAGCQAKDIPLPSSYGVPDSCQTGWWQLRSLPGLSPPPSLLLSSAELVGTRHLGDHHRTIMSAGGLASITGLKSYEGMRVSGRQISRETA